MPEIINGKPSAAEIEEYIVTDEAATVLNTTHRGSDGSDHSKVGANETAIGLNTTHRGSDGSDHSKVNTIFGWGDHSGLYHEFVHRDLPASVDFVSTYNEGGTITSQQDFHCIDSAAGFITAGIQIGAWVNNWSDSTWAQVTAVNSETDLTLDANIFPADDGDGYNTYHLRGGAWYDLDLSSIIGLGSALVLLRVQLDANNTNQYIFFRKNGVASTLEINGLKMQVANLPIYGSVSVACDANRIIEYKLESQDRTCNIVVAGWWK